MTPKESTALRVVRSPEPADDSAAQEAAAPTVPRPPLGSLLIDEGFVTKEQIQEALREAEHTNERLGEVLLRRGLVGEHDLARTIARQWALTFTEEAELSPDPRPSTLLQPKEMAEIGGVPVRFDGGRVIVAVADPTDGRLACMHALLGHQVSLVVVTRSCLDRLLRGETLLTAVVAEPSANGAETERSANGTEPEHDAEPPVELRPNTDEEPQVEVQPPDDETPLEAGSILGELDGAMATLVAFRPRLGELSEALARAKERSSALADAEQKLAENASRIRELTAAVDLERTRAADLGSAVEAEQARSSELDAALEAEKAHINELGAALETERSRASEVGKALEAEQVRIAEVGAALETERSRASELGKALEAEQVRIGEVAAALEAERSRAAELGPALDAERARTAELVAAVEERDQLVAAVRAKLAAVTDALSA